MVAFASLLRSSSLIKLSLSELLSFFLGFAVLILFPHMAAGE